jgi:hypothetical protein
VFSGTDPQLLREVFSGHQEPSDDQTNWQSESAIDVIRVPNGHQSLISARRQRRKIPQSGRANGHLQSSIKI